MTVSFIVLTFPVHTINHTGHTERLALATDATHPDASAGRRRRVWPARQPTRAL